MNEIFPISLNQETLEASNCINEFVSHREITLILNGRSAKQHICVYDVLSGCTLSFNSLKSPLLKKYLNG